MFVRSLKIGITCNWHVMQFNYGKYTYMFQYWFSIYVTNIKLAVSILYVHKCLYVSGCNKQNEQVPFVPLINLVKMFSNYGYISLNEHGCCTMRACTAGLKQERQLWVHSGRVLFFFTLFLKYITLFFYFTEKFIFFLFYIITK